MVSAQLDRVSFRLVGRKQVQKATLFSKLVAFCPPPKNFLFHPSPAFPCGGKILLYQSKNYFSEILRNWLTIGVIPSGIFFI